MIPTLKRMLVYSLFLHTQSTALQLHKSWQAAPKKSILAASHLILPQENADNPPIQLLATAGHEAGTIRLWQAPFGESDGIPISVHKGSVFSLSSNNNDLLLSGSFDRSATLQRIQTSENDGTSNNNLIFASSNLAALTEHTGWVRGVRIVPIQQDKFFLLSIGCNLINVWTTLNDDETTPIRLARLDAGPSPGDPHDEPFRRHDILSVTVQDDASNIVAGLVDGTLRSFKGKWKFWNERRNEKGEFVYDCTGSCGNMVDVNYDDRPCAAIRAHRGRVTGVHALPNANEFISVGYDGWWRHWRLEEGSLFIMCDEGHVEGDQYAEDETNDCRICSSVVIPRNKESTPLLVVGTTGGRIYSISLKDTQTPQSKCSKIWKETEKDCSITALTWAPYSSSEHQLIACNSDGIVRVFI